MNVVHWLIRYDKNHVFEIFCYSGHEVPYLVYTIRPNIDKYIENAKFLMRTCKLCIDNFENKLKISELKLSANKIYGHSGNYPDLPITKINKEDAGLVKDFCEATNRCKII